jgi:hypothetical protein
MQVLTPVDLANPRPGFYEIRLVRGGVFVPVHIFAPLAVECHADACQLLDRYHHPQARLGWDLVPITKVWPTCARWPITAADYLHGLRRIQWANASASWAPEARPGERIDLNELPSLF